MKNQKMTIITAVSICIAVFAVLLLVLFMTGVIQLGGQRAINVSAYDYLCAHGTFGTSSEDGGMSEYSWASSYEPYRIVGFKGEQIHCYFYGSYFSAAINEDELDFNAGSDSREAAYAEFTKWCETIGYTPNQIVEALDEYAESQEQGKGG